MKKDKIKTFRIYCNAFKNPIYIETNDEIIEKILFLNFSPYISRVSYRNEINSLLLYKKDDHNLCIKFNNEQGNVPLNMVNHIIFATISKNIELKDNYIFLHSALLEKNGVGFFLLGGSNSGKSTLSAFLCSNGYQYGSDDKIIVSTNLQEVYILNRKIQLRKASLDILSNQGVHINYSNNKFYEYKRIECLDINPIVINNIRIALKVNRNENACTGVSLNELSADQTFKELLYNSYISKNLNKIAANSAFIASKIKGYSLEYNGDMRELEKYLTKIIK